MKSLRQQLTVALSAACAALLLAFTAIIFFATKHVMVRQFDATLSAKAQALIAAAEVDGKKFEFDFTVQDFAGFGSGVGGDYFEVRREDRSLVAVSPSLGLKSLPTCDVPTTDKKSIVATTLLDGRPARMIIMRFDPSDDKKQRFPNLHLIVASQSKDLQRHLHILALVLLVCALLALLATVPLVRWVLVRGLRPLDRMSKEVESIEATELTRTISTEGLVGELQPIAQRLNDLFARLDQSFAREKRFSSQAAHELRTPLAELKTMAELGERWPEEATPERCREMLQIIAELESIMEKLALLARSDEGCLPLHQETIDLETFHQTIVARSQALISERSLLIELVKPLHPTWKIDRFLLTSLYQNLFDNAITYAPSGSLIQCRLDRGTIAIKNAAPELNQQDLAVMFDRFWQKNHARNDSQHSGLGLSIVASCAKLVDASIHTTLTEGQFCIEIRWSDSSSQTI